jgi:hypothetical protein
MKKLFAFLIVFIALSGVAQMVKAMTVKFDSSYDTGLNFDRNVDGIHKASEVDLFNVSLTYGPNDPHYVGSSFYALCIEPAVTISQGNTITGYFKPTDYHGYLNTGSVPNTGLYAAWLFDTYFNAGSNNVIGGLQVAIWEVTKDTSFSLTSGNFYLYNNVNTVAATNATSYLNALAAHTFTVAEIDRLNSQYLIFSDNNGTNHGYQDLIVKTGTPTPEPATMLLFGAGIAGIAGLRFRKRN